MAAWAWHKWVAHQSAQPIFLPIEPNHKAKVLMPNARQKEPKARQCTVCDVAAKKVQVAIKSVCDGAISCFHLPCVNLKGEHFFVGCVQVGEGFVLRI